MKVNLISSSAATFDEDGNEELSLFFIFLFGKFLD